MIMKTVFLIIILFIINQKEVAAQIRSVKMKEGVDPTIPGHVYNAIVRDSAYKFDHANYSIYIPEGIKYIRGIFIHQHGCGMEGTGAASAYDIQYEAFAKKWDLAIIGPDIFPKKGSGCGDWINPEDGSGPAILTAINSFAKVSGHYELNNVPWLLWGHSGGGYWVLKMMSEYPSRILASFCYSPAFDPDLTYPQSVEKIPVFLRHAGKEDLSGCWSTATHAFIKFRKLNSFAVLANTPGQTHNFSYVRYMAIPFFESILSQRLPKPGSTLLKDMDTSKAWLGDTLTHKIYKLSTYHKSTNAMSLLPDSLIAVKWQEYVSTGTVVDHSAPPPPSALTIKKDDSSAIYLTWKVQGDIESPIQYFNIYRNNKLIGRFPKLNRYQSFDTNGDNALPAIPLKIKYLINSPIKKSDTFSVTEVNQFNLESNKIIIKMAQINLGKD